MKFYSIRPCVCVINVFLINDIDSLFEFYFIHEKEKVVKNDTFIESESVHVITELLFLHDYADLKNVKVEKMLSLTVNV